MGCVIRQQPVTRSFLLIISARDGSLLILIAKSLRCLGLNAPGLYGQGWKQTARSSIQSLWMISPVSGLRIPRLDQVSIWQAAVGLLEWSIYFWMGGYLVFIWDLTRVSREGQTVADQVVCTWPCTRVGWCIY